MSLLSISYFLLRVNRNMKLEYSGRRSKRDCGKLCTTEHFRLFTVSDESRSATVDACCGDTKGMKVGWRTRENCSICSFVTFALCRTDKRNYTVRPEWYIPLHFHTRHTFSLLFPFPIYVARFPLCLSLLFYTFPHFPHRMHRQPILIQFYHPQDSIVSSILLFLFCHRMSLSNSAIFVFRHKYVQPHYTLAVFYYNIIVH